MLTNGCLIFAECNGSGKQEVAEEIARRCNEYDRLVGLCERSLRALHEDDFPSLRQELRDALTDCGTQ